MSQSAEKDAPVHGIDRHTQAHLCGTPNGLGTDAIAPAMPITCAACRAVWPNLREGDCWLCTHPVWGPMCSACSCLAHYPPWPATSVIPPGDTYVCPTTGETESRTMGGFDVCCDHPECPGNTRVLPPAKTEGDPIIHRPGCSWETTPHCDCGADPERTKEES